MGEGRESGGYLTALIRCVRYDDPEVFHISTDSTTEGIEVASEYSAEEFVIACTGRDHKA